MRPTGRRLWLGLDVGTSSTKAVLVDDEGSVLGRGSSAYPTHRTTPDRAEQDPMDYVRAVAAAAAGCGVAEHPPSGVALVGQTPTLVLADELGRPVMPALSWQDQRAEQEARELESTLGEPFPVVGTSLPWTGSTLPSKLLWIARQKADVLRSARWALQPKDFVALLMTGVATSDPWSSKGLCRVDTGAPCLPVFELAGADPALLPEIRAAWEPCAPISTAGAREFGLPAGTPVAVGWSDALAGMLGVGAFEQLGQPVPFALTGTSDIVGTTVRDGPPDAWPLFSVPATCAPMQVIYGPTSTSGASLLWLADLLDVPVPELLDAAAGLGDDADIPVFLPYLDGERAPLWRSDIGAGFSGLRHRHTRAHLARAVLAGVACSERHVLDTADSLRTDQLPGPTEPRAERPVRTAGAGASHPAWLQVRSATFGRPVSAVDDPGLTAVGAAMLAAAAATGGSLSGAAAMAPRAVIEHPDPAGAGPASDHYARYRAESEHACATQPQTA